MRRRISSRWSMTLLAVVGLFVANVAHRAEARPKYKAAFESEYPEVVKKMGKDGKLTCKVCHVGDDDKKKRNHYGNALAKELKKKNEMDEKTIKEALKAIEDGDCKTGKWKERLDEGKWPCTCGDGGREPNSYIARQLNRDSH